jgi:hypothetical protein
MHRLVCGKVPGIKQISPRAIAMKKVLLSILILTFGFAAEAGEKPPAGASKYAGQQTRTIKSLSPDDIAELKRGGGWGLARAAELNGVPGPAHLFEMKAQIPLRGDQVAAITKIYREMKAEAIEQGQKLIETERALESHFKNRTITDAILRSSLVVNSGARMALRYIHLGTHLKTPAILSPAQIAKYNSLRGYSDPGSCANIPAGHDAKMWRRHNGCQK